LTYTSLSRKEKGRVGEYGNRDGVIKRINLSKSLLCRIGNAQRASRITREDGVEKLMVVKMPSYHLRKMGIRAFLPYQESVELLALVRSRRGKQVTRFTMSGNEQTEGKPNRRNPVIRRSLVRERGSLCLPRTQRLIENSPFRRAMPKARRGSWKEPAGDALEIEGLTLILRPRRRSLRHTGKGVEERFFAYDRGSVDVQEYRMK